MNGRHPAPHELSAFIDGELDHASAFAIAQHLDSCAPCRQLCHAADELHQRLASADLDVPPPQGLAQEILHAAATEPAPPRGRANVVVMALLAASGLFFMMLGAPADLLAESSEWGHGISVAAGALSRPLESETWLAAPGIAGVAAVALYLNRHRPGAP